MQAFGVVTHKQPLIFTLEMVQKIFIYCFNVILSKALQSSITFSLNRLGIVHKAFCIKQMIQSWYKRVHNIHICSSNHCNKICLL